MKKEILLVSMVECFLHLLNFGGLRAISRKCISHLHEQNKRMLLEQYPSIRDSLMQWQFQRLVSALSCVGPRRTNIVAGPSSIQRIIALYRKNQLIGYSFI